MKLTVAVLLALLISALPANSFAQAPPAPEAPPAPPVTPAPDAPPTTPPAEPQDEAAEATAETTLADQIDVAVTAYSTGLAFVRDVRRLALPQGEFDLRFADVAQLIAPETVSLRSVNAPGSLSVLEQNYEFDLISPSKMMEKYVGKQVELVNFNREIGFERVRAELLSVNEGPIYRIGSQIFLGHPGNVVLPEIPANLVARPSLIWKLINEVPEQTVEAAYLSTGMSWKADYVLNLTPDERMMDLNGWVTLTNQTGATFTNALLKLVAGDVNVVREPPRPKMQRAAYEMAAAAPMPAQEAFGEYHLYTLPRRTTVKQNQTKQVALLKAQGVQVQKRYEFRAQEYYFVQIIPPPRERDEKVAVFLEFENEQANKLGIPLPGGVMRVYQQDSQGMLQFSGEDRIQHTPKDEKVSIRLGNAFDVTGERIQTDFQQIANNVTESAYRITLRNHKDQDIVVEVIEPMPGDWEVLQNSHNFEKKDARTIVFKVPVPVDGEVQVEYRVRVTT